MAKTTTSAAAPNPAPLLNVLTRLFLDRTQSGDLASVEGVLRAFNDTEFYLDLTTVENGTSRTIRKWVPKPLVILVEQRP